MIQFIYPDEKNLIADQRTFLNRAALIADSNLTKVNFTVEEFSRLMGLSRSQLFRRLKSTTGQSVSAFIRNRRLKRAITLMDQGVRPLQKICKAVGFGGESYFCRSFKKEYGIPPSKYRKNSSEHKYINRDFQHTTFPSAISEGEQFNQMKRKTT